MKIIKLLAVAFLATTSAATFSQTLFVPGTIGSTTLNQILMKGTDRTWLKIGGPSTSSYSVADLMFTTSETTGGYINGSKYWDWSFRSDAWTGNFGDFVLYTYDQTGGYTSPIIAQTDGDLALCSGTASQPRKGNVGIGTITPIEKLHVDGNARFGDQWSSNITLGSLSNSQNFLRNFMGFNLSHNGTNWSVYDNANNGASGILSKGSGKMLFVSIPDNAGTIDDNTIAIDYSVMSIYQAPSEGRVVLGTINRDANLYVNGTAKAHMVEVLTTTWSDFVFDNDYQLKSLTEVEKYITKNNHLPDVPSEAEVLKDGINLGQMDAILLQKIEELTLYTIEQQKLIEDMKGQLKKLSKKVN